MEYKFLVTEFFCSQKHLPFSLLNFFFKIFHGVLKQIENFGGGDFGVFGASHAPTRGSRGVGKRYTSYDHDM